MMYDHWGVSVNTICNGMYTLNISTSQIKLHLGVDKSPPQVVKMMGSNVGNGDKEKGVMFSLHRDIIDPFTQQTDLSFITLYDLKGDIFAQTESHAVLGHSDDLKPLVDQSLKDNEIYTTVTLHNNKLLLVSLQRMGGISGPAGVTAVGFYLGEKFINEITKGTGTAVALSYDNQIVTTSLGDVNVPSDYEQITLTFPDLNTAKPFSVILLEDNTASLMRFRREQGIALAVIVFASVFSIGLLLIINSSISNRIAHSLQILHRVEKGDLSA
jgi:hypothetical protein